MSDTRVSGDQLNVFWFWVQYWSGHQIETVLCVCRTPLSGTNDFTATKSRIVQLCLELTSTVQKVADLCLLLSQRLFVLIRTCLHGQRAELHVRCQPLKHQQQL